LFSRRYGFVMAAMSDPLPAGTQMWIRNLSGPLELKFYRYAASVPNAFGGDRHHCDSRRDALAGTLTRKGIRAGNTVP
jgi:hypothetical protein